MSTPTNIQSELNRHRSENATRLQQMVEQQFNTEITRSFVLTFYADDYGDAEGLGRLLFAKGMRLLTLQPEHTESGAYHVRAVVKHSLREITQEDFICDLINLASGVRAIYRGWALLAPDAAEETQPHDSTPDIQQ